MPKVSGGAEALPNEFPWQAYLKIEYDNLQVEQCGGVLVDNDVVLTAAHCVKGVNILHGVLWAGFWWTMMWSSQKHTVLKG